MKKADMGEGRRSNLEVTHNVKERRVTDEKWKQIWVKVRAGERK